MPNRSGLVAFGLFALTIPAANWLIGNVGTVCIPQGPCLIPVGFGLDAPSGVLMVGAALVLRDIVHERLGALWALGAIALGAVLSLLLAPPALAVASVAAFGLAELADFFVYSKLRQRITPLDIPGAFIRQRNIPLAVLASGLVGSIIDSAVFLTLAFGSLAHIEGQIVGKMWMTIAAVGVLFAMRRVRYPA